MRTYYFIAEVVVVYGHRERKRSTRARHRYTTLYVSLRSAAVSLRSPVRFYRRGVLSLVRRLVRSDVMRCDIYIHSIRLVIVISRVRRRVYS